MATAVDSFRQFLQSAGLSDFSDQELAEALNSQDGQLSIGDCTTLTVALGPAKEQSPPTVRNVSTGRFELQQADNRVRRDAFLYMEPKPGQKEEDFGQCSRCVLYTGQTCVIHGKLPITPTSSCSLYVYGEPLPANLGKEVEQVTPTESGLVDHPVRCENCLFSRNDGTHCYHFHELTEQLPRMYDLDPHINPKGCCNAHKPKEGALSHNTDQREQMLHAMAGHATKGEWDRHDQVQQDYNASYGDNPYAKKLAKRRRVKFGPDSVETILHYPHKSANNGIKHLWHNRMAEHHTLAAGQNGSLDRGHVKAAQHHRAMAELYGHEPEHREDIFKQHQRLGVLHPDAALSLEDGLSSPSGQVSLSGDWIGYRERKGGQEKRFYRNRLTGEQRDQPPDEPAANQIGNDQWQRIHHTYNHAGKVEYFDSVNKEADKLQDELAKLPTAHVVTMAKEFGVYGAKNKKQAAEGIIARIRDRATSASRTAFGLPNPNPQQQPLPPLGDNTKATLLSGKQAIPAFPIVPPTPLPPKLTGQHVVQAIQHLTTPENKGFLHIAAIRDHLKEHPRAHQDQAIDDAIKNHGVTGQAHEGGHGSSQHEIDSIYHSPASGQIGWLQLRNKDARLSFDGSETPPAHEHHDEPAAHDPVQHHTGKIKALITGIHAGTTKPEHIDQALGDMKENLNRQQHRDVLTNLGIATKPKSRDHAHELMRMLLGWHQGTAQKVRQIAGNNPVEPALNQPKEPWQMSRDEFAAAYKEPPVPKDTTRYYRGQKAGGSGEWWTPSLEVAETFALNNEDPENNEVSYIDIPSKTNVDDFAVSQEDTPKDEQAFKFPEGLRKNAKFLKPALPHEFLVEKAHKAGKPIPKEVLAEYPDLQQHAMSLDDYFERAPNGAIMFAEGEGAGGPELAGDKPKPVEIKSHEHYQSELGKLGLPKKLHQQFASEGEQGKENLKRLGELHLGAQQHVRRLNAIKAAQQKHAAAGNPLAKKTVEMQPPTAQPTKLSRAQKESIAGVRAVTSHDAAVAKFQNNQELSPDDRAAAVDFLNQINKHYKKADGFTPRAVTAMINAAEQPQPASEPGTAAALPQNQPDATPAQTNGLSSESRLTAALKHAGEHSERLTGIKRLGGSGDLERDLYDLGQVDTKHLDDLYSQMNQTGLYKGNNEVFRSLHNVFASAKKDAQGKLPRTREQIEKSFGSVGQQFEDASAALEKLGYNQLAEYYAGVGSSVAEAAKQYALEHFAGAKKPQPPAAASVRPVIKSSDVPTDEPQEDPRTDQLPLPGMDLPVQDKSEPTTLPGMSKEGLQQKPAEKKPPTAVPGGPDLFNQPPEPEQPAAAQPPAPEAKAPEQPAAPPEKIQIPSYFRHAHIMEIHGPESLADPKKRKGIIDSELQGRMASARKVARVPSDKLPPHDADKGEIKKAIERAKKIDPQIGELVSDKLTTYDMAPGLRGLLGPKGPRYESASKIELAAINSFLDETEGKYQPAGQTPSAEQPKSPEAAAAPPAPLAPPAAEQPKAETAAPESTKQTEQAQSPQWTPDAAYHKNPKDEYSVPLHDLHFDPERFQFRKIGVNERGVTNRLGGVKTWDADSGGPIYAWHDPQNGLNYIVNGHHRVDLANRLSKEGHKSAPSRLRVKFIDAPDAATARTEGALQNMRDDSANPIDAAVWMKDTGKSLQELEGLGVNISTSARMSDAVHLARLSDRVLGAAKSGILEPSQAAQIGKYLNKVSTPEEVADTHVKQNELYDVIRKEEQDTGRKIHPDIVEIMSRKFANTPEGQRLTQGDMFGGKGVSLWMSAAKMEGDLRKKIKQRLAANSTLGSDKNKKIFDEDGHEIDVPKAKKNEEEATKILAMMNDAQFKGTPITMAINNAVREADANPEKREEILGRLYRGLPSILQETDRQGIQRHGGAVPPTGGESDLGDYLGPVAGAKPAAPTIPTQAGQQPAGPEQPPVTLPPAAGTEPQLPEGEPEREKYRHLGQGTGKGQYFINPATKEGKWLSGNGNVHPIVGKDLEDKIRQKIEGDKDNPPNPKWKEQLTKLGLSPADFAVPAAGQPPVQQPQPAPQQPQSFAGLKSLADQMSDPRKLYHMESKKGNPLYADRMIDISGHKQELQNLAKVAKSKIDAEAAQDPKFKQARDLYKKINSDSQGGVHIGKIGDMYKDGGADAEIKEIPGVNGGPRSVQVPSDTCQTIQAHEHLHSLERDLIGLPPASIGGRLTKYDAESIKHLLGYISQTAPQQPQATQPLTNDDGKLTLDQLQEQSLKTGRPIRVYGGQVPGGRYTTDLAEAQRYAQQSNGQVQYVDIPGTRDAWKGIAAGANRPTHHVVLTSELSGQAKPLAQSQPPAPAAPQPVQQPTPAQPVGPKPPPNEQEIMSALTSEEQKRLVQLMGTTGGKPGIKDSNIAEYNQLMEIGRNRLMGGSQQTPTGAGQSQQPAQGGTGQPPTTGQGGATPPQQPPGQGSAWPPDEEEEKKPLPPFVPHYNEAKGRWFIHERGNKDPIDKRGHKQKPADTLREMNQDPDIAHETYRQHLEREAANRQEMEDILAPHLRNGKALHTQADKVAKQVNGQAGQMVSQIDDHTAKRADDAVNHHVDAVEKEFGFSDAMKLMATALVAYGIYRIVRRHPFLSAAVLISIAGLYSRRNKTAQSDGSLPTSWADNDKPVSPEDQEKAQRLVEDSLARSLPKEQQDEEWKKIQEERAERQQELMKRMNAANPTFAATKPTVISNTTPIEQAHEYQQAQQQPAPASEPTKKPLRNQPTAEQVKAFNQKLASQGSPNGRYLSRGETSGVDYWTPGDGSVWWDSVMTGQSGRLPDKHVERGVRKYGWKLDDQPMDKNTKISAKEYAEYRILRNAVDSGKPLDEKRQKRLKDLQGKLSLAGQ